MEKAKPASAPAEQVVEQLVVIQALSTTAEANATTESAAKTAEAKTAVKRAPLVEFVPGNGVPRCDAGRPTEGGGGNVAPLRRGLQCVQQV